MPAPAPRSRALGWDGHLLLLHRSEPERLLRLAEWMRHGLQRGEKVVYVEPVDAGRDSVAVQMGEHGIDTGALRADGRLEILAPEVYYPVGAPEAVVDRALTEGFPAVRISGAATSALSVVTPAGHRDIEWGVDRLCRTRPVSALCQYAYPDTAGPLLRAALDTHPSGFRELSLAGGGTRSRLVLQGSVDVANVEVLASLLRAAADGAAAAATSRLHVDLTDAVHLAATACRAVAQASEPFRTAGGILVLEGADPAVEQVLRICGLAELPGVEFAGTGS
jgi:anti-anti-sigma factor